MKMKTIDSLQIKGEPAPKHNEPMAPLNTTMRLNRPATHAATTERAYPFLIHQTESVPELTMTGHAHASAPVRKMEHLSRVRTANFGMSTMDSNLSSETIEHETHFIIDKPRFVLCGLPIGSKDIDHHLYVSETRVGNFKTSAKALYQARNGPKSGKTFSDPIPAIGSVEQQSNPTNGELEESATQRAAAFPPMPPTTPVNYALAFMNKPQTAPCRNIRGLNTPRPNNSDHEPRLTNGLCVRQKKMVLHSRDESTDMPAMSREHSSVSTRSSRTIETVKGSVVNNSLTVSAGKRPKLMLGAYVKHVSKVNYNNPYRNTKYKERLALKGSDRVEFNNVDSYLKYQKQQNQNGKHIMTPRAILKIPNPCPDNFLLQMMYELNRPKSRRSGPSSAKYSDIARTRDLEEFVLERTSSSLSKTQSNIDRFMGRKSSKSLKSGKSSKSAKSAPDAETIEEEDTWEEEEVLNDDDSTEDKL